MHIVLSIIINQLFSGEFLPEYPINKSFIIPNSIKDKLLSAGFFSIEKILRILNVHYMFPPMNQEYLKFRENLSCPC